MAMLNNQRVSLASAGSKSAPGSSTWHGWPPGMARAAAINHFSNTLSRASGNLTMENRYFFGKIIYIWDEMGLFHTFFFFHSYVKFILKHIINSRRLSVFPPFFVSGNWFAILITRAGGSSSHDHLQLLGCHSYILRTHRKRIERTYQDQHELFDPFRVLHKKVKQDQT